MALPDYLACLELMENAVCLEFLGRGARWVGRDSLVILEKGVLQDLMETLVNWVPQVLPESLDSLVTWALLES